MRKYWDNPVNAGAGVLARAVAIVPDRVMIGDAVELAEERNGVPFFRKQ